MFDVLTYEFLSKISVESSLCVNLANFSMSKFTDEDLDKIFDDIMLIQEEESFILKTLVNTGIDFRIKSFDSIQLKIKKYQLNSRKAILCFNDFIGFRVICDSLPDLSEIQDYFKIIDLSNGKVDDDGYRGLHLYFKLSNRHYPVEVQIWSKHDAQFMNWMHKYSYKHLSSEVGRRLRQLYDKGSITTESEFKQELDVILACQYFNQRFGG